MRRRITLDDAKSYATVENLDRALERYGFSEDRHLVCRTASGRWTAVFPASNLTPPEGCGYLGYYSQHGFMTLG